MKFAPILAALTLSACAAVPAGPIVSSPYETAAQGSAVGFNRPVWVGDVVITPLRLVEDSRCPMNARCIQAGKAVLETRIDGDGWRQTDRLTLGEPQVVHDKTVVLSSVMPGTIAGQPIDPAVYRFAFELR